MDLKQIGADFAAERWNKYRIQPIYLNAQDLAALAWTGVFGDYFLVGHFYTSGSIDCIEVIFEGRAQAIGGVRHFEQRGTAQDMADERWRAVPYVRTEPFQKFEVIFDEFTDQASDMSNYFIGYKLSKMTLME